MSISFRAIGIVAALIAFAGVAGWVARPDLRDRVRLISPTSVPWITAGHSVSAASAAPPSAPPCSQADLDAWQMPTPPDATSRHVTLYSDRIGAKRAAQGDMLVPGVMVASVTSTQVTLTCVSDAPPRSIRQSRQLNAAQPLTPSASPSPQAARPLAPLGN